MLLTVLLAQRILYVTPVAIGVSVICFLLVHLAPGDLLHLRLPIDATAAQQAEMRKLRLDRPLPSSTASGCGRRFTATSATRSPAVAQRSGRSGRAVDNS